MLCPRREGGDYCPLMTRYRFNFTVPAVLFLAMMVTLLGAPAHGVQGVRASQDPGVDTGGPARVQVACTGGPGRLSVAVFPPTVDGAHPVEVTGDRMVEGSTWRVWVDQEDDDGARKRFRRTAVDGRWSINTKIEGSLTNELFFIVGARGRHDQADGSFTCISFVFLFDKSAGGIGPCGKGYIGMLARRRNDGSTALSVFQQRGEPKTRWNVAGRAKADGFDQTVRFQDYSNRYSELLSRVRFQGLPVDARFSLRISNARRATCWMRLNPGFVPGQSHTAERDDEVSVPRLLRRLPPA